MSYSATTITIARDRLHDDLLPGDLIIAIDGESLRRPLTVVNPDVRVGVANTRAIRLESLPGATTEWHLYPDQLGPELTVSRNTSTPEPAPAAPMLVGRGYKDIGYIARKWGHAHGVFASGSGHLSAVDQAAYDTLPPAVRGDGLPPTRQSAEPTQRRDDALRLRTRGTVARYSVVMAGWATLGRILEKLGIIAEHDGRWYFTDKAAL